MASVTQHHHLLPSYHHHLHQNSQVHHRYYLVNSHPHSHRFNVAPRGGEKRWSELPIKINLLSNSLTSRLRTSAHQRMILASTGPAVASLEDVSRLALAEELGKRFARSSSRRYAKRTPRPFVLGRSRSEGRSATRAVGQSTQSHLPSVEGDRSVFLTSSLTDQPLVEEVQAGTRHLPDREDEDRAVPPSSQSTSDASEIVDPKGEANLGHDLVSDRNTACSVNNDCFQVRLKTTGQTGSGLYKDQCVGSVLTSTAHDQAGQAADTTVSHSTAPQTMWMKRTSQSQPPSRHTTQRQGQHLPEPHHRGLSGHCGSGSPSTRPKSSVSIISSSWGQDPGSKRVVMLKDPSAQQSHARRTGEQASRQLRVLWKDLSTPQTNRDSECKQVTAWSFRLRSADTIVSDLAMSRPRNPRMTSNGQVPVIGVTWRLPSPKSGRPPAPFCEELEESGALSSQDHIKDG